MAGRGGQSFKKRQKEQQRKEKQAEKLQKRLLRKQNKELGITDESDELLEAVEPNESESEPGSESETEESPARAD
jgi:hypothetical protein